MSEILAETLFGMATLRVDLFRQRPRQSGDLVVTFSDWGHRDLDGPGYAGDFLRGEGHDVLAFKLVRDDWYQHVPRELFAWIRLRLERFAYARRVGYGSSMGGYAAIQFSGLLELDQVLAFSPQYRIDDDFDTTWASWAQGLDFEYRIDGETIGAATRFLIVYDSADTDRGHAERLAALIPAERRTLVGIPYAGHPVDKYLNEVDLLKTVARQGLATGRLEGLDLRRGRRESRHYLAALSMAAHHRGRPRSSLGVIERALQRYPKVPEFHSHRAALLEMLGRPSEALEAARQGAEQCPEHADLMAYQAHLLERLGEPGQALSALERALQLAPEHAEYRQRYEALRAANR